MLIEIWIQALMDCGKNPIMGSLICPKPRRLPLRNQAEVFISKGGPEIIDLIIKEDGIATTRNALDLSSSPPFFSGSPPCRAMNPLIHDDQFAKEKQQYRISSSPSPSTSSSSPSSSSSSSCYKGMCARASTRGKPQSPNRVEGFDCRNSRLAAMV